MRFRNHTRFGRVVTLRGGAGPAVLAATLALSACSADYVENNETPVLLLIQSINGGAQLDSDVRFGVESTFICEDEVDVTVTVMAKNPGVTTTPTSTVLLDSYEVRYTRSDGRGTEGIDVPYRITGNLALSVELDAEATFPLEVVRRQAKLDPPLNNIFQTTIVTMTAHVTLFGKTITEKRVSASGAFQIDFADFGDDETSCPTD